MAIMDRKCLTVYLMYIVRSVLFLVCNMFYLIFCLYVIFPLIDFSSARVFTRFAHKIPFFYLILLDHFQLKTYDIQIHGSFPPMPYPNLMTNQFQSEAKYLIIYAYTNIYLYLIFRLNFVFFFVSIEKLEHKFSGD